MALCVSPSAYFFSITSTFPNAVYEKGRVFPVQSLLVHPLCCFFLLIPQCSFTVIPAICKQASTLQREILKVSTVTQPIWLHMLGQILPQNCHIQLLLKELFAVFWGTPSDPIKGIQKNREKNKLLSRSDEAPVDEKNIFSAEKTDPHYQSVILLRSYRTHRGQALLLLQ